MEWRALGRCSEFLTKNFLGVTSACSDDNLFAHLEHGIQLSKANAIVIEFTELYEANRSAHFFYTARWAPAGHSVTFCLQTV